MNRSSKLFKKCLRATIVTVVVLEILMIVSTIIIVSFLCLISTSNCFQDMYNIVDPILHLGLLVLSVFIGTISGFILMWREDYKLSRASKK